MCGLLFGSTWVSIKDGNPYARSMYRRHYSCYHYKDGRQPKKFVGPGEYMALMTETKDALCVWRKFRSMDQQEGVNCAIFRNEGEKLSSELLLEGMKLAWSRWAGERLYTYVNAAKILSVNPGYCFLKAGWRRCGRTKVNQLHILEVYPAWIT